MDELYNFLTLDQVQVIIINFYGEQLAEVKLSLMTLLVSHCSTGAHF